MRGILKLEIKLLMVLLNLEIGRLGVSEAFLKYSPDLPISKSPCSESKEGFQLPNEGILVHNFSSINHVNMV